MLLNAAATYFKDEITDLLPLDKQHRENWLSSTGFLTGLNEVERLQTLHLFELLLNNWQLYRKYDKIYEFMIPMIRRAINYLYSEESMIWSIKRDDKRLFVYRHNFKLLDYVNHFNEIFVKNEHSFQETFQNIDAQAELCHLCIRDYFYKLAKESKTEDYEIILRDLKINSIIK